MKVMDRGDDLATKLEKLAMESSIKHHTSIMHQAGALSSEEFRGGKGEAPVGTE